MKHKFRRWILIEMITAAVVMIFGSCGKINTEKSFDEENRGQIYCKEINLDYVVSEECGEFMNNEILLSGASDSTYKQIEKIAKKYDAEIVGWIEQTNDYQIELAGSYSLEELKELAEKISKEKKVDSATPNYVFAAGSESKEETMGIKYGKKWASDLKNFHDVKGKSWGIEAIGAVDTWNLLSRIKNTPVKVGLIDNGFDLDHKDLGFREVLYNTQTGDHGCHVAGIMAAKSDNDEGICGVYPYGNGNLYAVSNSVTGIQSYSENKDIMTSSMSLKIAYSELILRNVKIINESSGFNYYKWDNVILPNTEAWNARTLYLEENEHILGDFFQKLLDLGYDFVIVNAAGNDSNRDRNIVYDSRYNWWTNLISEENYPEVYQRIIVVGAIDEKYNIANFSNAGERVDIYAPGVNIYSCMSNNKYGKMTGTSMAAPHVSGVAAMAWTANPNLTGAQVKEIVCRYSNTRCQSCKLVDSYAVVRAAAIETGQETAIPENYGGILCWVVDKDDEGLPVSGIDINIVNNDDHTKYTFMTDEDGHAEIFVPEGRYSLSIDQEGYLEYKINSIDVIRNGVNYLNDWIKLKRIPAVTEELVLSHLKAASDYYWKWYMSDELCDQTKWITAPYKGMERYVYYKLKGVSTLSEFKEKTHKYYSNSFLKEHFSKNSWAQYVERNGKVYISLLDGRGDAFYCDLVGVDFQKISKTKYKIDLAEACTYEFGTPYKKTLYMVFENDKWVFQGDFSYYPTDSVFMPMGEFNEKCDINSSLTQSDIMEIQRTLIAMNYDGLTANGYYFWQMSDAIKRFQKNHDIVPDGVCDENTRNCIQDALKKWVEKKGANSKVYIQYARLIDDLLKQYTTDGFYYNDYLNQEVLNSHSICSLFDLNGDGIDEFILELGNHEGNYEFYFYTIVDGEVKKIGAIPGYHRSLAKDPDNNLILSFAHMGTASYTRVTWKEDRLVEENLETVDFIKNEAYAEKLEKKYTGIKTGYLQNFWETGRLESDWDW